jgi:hypothetical protein
LVIVPPAMEIGPGWFMSIVKAWVEALKSATQVSFRPSPPSASGAMAPVLMVSFPAPPRRRAGWKIAVRRSPPAPPVISKRSIPVKST